MNKEVSMKRLSVLAGILLAAILSGCVMYGEAYIPAPPPRRVEVITVAPYTLAVWVPGGWVWV